jgi:hypothetical protein
MTGSPVFWVGAHKVHVFLLGNKGVVGAHVCLVRLQGTTGEGGMSKAAALASGIARAAHPSGRPREPNRTRRQPPQPALTCVTMRSSKYSTLGSSCLSILRPVGAAGRPAVSNTSLAQCLGNSRTLPGLPRWRSSPSMHPHPPTLAPRRRIQHPERLLSTARKHDLLVLDRGASRVRHVDLAARAHDLVHLGACADMWQTWEG